MSKRYKIKKSSGKRQAFSVQKLTRSLKNVGVSHAEISRILDEVEAHLKEGVTTKEIYDRVFNYLKTSVGPAGARYKLKQAIREMGPTGYPFEKFVGKLFKAEGYRVKTGQLIKGECVSHEIDVIAIKHDKRALVECKFHNQYGIRCNVRVPLYFKSRFEDVVAVDHTTYSSTGWIVTNTQFTQDAITYGTKSGLTMVGWNYPKGRGLKEWIERHDLHPVTCLTTLLGREVARLLDSGVVLVSDIVKNPQVLANAEVVSERRHLILKEARLLCSHSKRDFSATIG